MGLTKSTPPWHGEAGAVEPLKTATYQSERGVVEHWFDPNSFKRHVVGYNAKNFAQFEDQDEAIRYMKQMYGIDAHKIREY